MRKRAIIGLIAALAAAAFASGGCGDSDETTALTKAQFAKQANAICKRTGEERLAEWRARQAASKGLSNDAASEELFREVFVIPFGEMVEEIEDLGPPKGDEQELEAIFREWRKGLKVFEKDPLLLLSEPPTLNKASKLAADYGMTECSSQASS